MTYESLLTGKLLADESNYGGKRGAAKYLVYHYDGNKAATAKNNVAYFNRDKIGVSAHLFVDENETWLSVPLDRIAWSVGTTTGYFHTEARNTNSISIEMCSRMNAQGQYYIPEATQRRAAQFGRALMADYSIPIGRVLRHYDITHKTCPEPFVRDAAQWRAFKKRLTQATHIQEDEDMLSYEQFKEYMTKYEQERELMPVSDWATTQWAALIQNKITDGSAPQAPLTREQYAVMEARKGK